jgi:hypothetical protein
MGQRVQDDIEFATGPDVTAKDGHENENHSANLKHEQRCRMLPHAIARAADLKCH